LPYFGMALYSLTIWVTKSLARFSSLAAFSLSTYRLEISKLLEDGGGEAWDL
jgi:hypothetical protein